MEIPPPQYPSFPFIPLIPKQALKLIINLSIREVYEVYIKSLWSKQSLEKRCFWKKTWPCAHARVLNDKQKEPVAGEDTHTSISWSPPGDVCYYHKSNLIYYSCI
jgi:hypothetical protein